MEVCLDSRIESGIIDVNNILHREIIAERLIDDGVDITTVTKMINELAIRDGKYPDRQAYNKEGWLVTFPSPEYKNAAIKRGTHFANDPTHGKGGMNIYYKRKGKQKRMTQQDPSVAEPSQPSQPSSPEQPSQPPAQPTKASASTEPSAVSANGKQNSQQGDGGSSLPKSDADNESAEDFGDDETPESVKNYEKGPKGRDAKATPQTGEQPGKPAPVAPPAAPVAPSFFGISVEFAKSKQWTPTPYGEWRNAMGETSAIVALSGEVVPIKSTDREELKLLAAKKR